MEVLPRSPWEHWSVRQGATLGVSWPQDEFPNQQPVVSPLRQSWHQTLIVSWPVGTV